MCPYAGLPARTTALARRCLLSSGAGVRTARGPTPAESPRGSASVKVAQRKGTPGETEGEPEPGNGRRDRTGERRTKGNQRKAEEGEEPGGQTGNRRQARRGEPEDVR